MNKPILAFPNAKNLLNDCSKESVSIGNSILTKPKKRRKTLAQILFNSSNHHVNRVVLLYEKEIFMEKQCILIAFDCFYDPLNLVIRIQVVSIKFRLRTMFEAF